MGGIFFHFGGEVIARHQFYSHVRRERRTKPFKIEKTSRKKWTEFPEKKVKIGERRRVAEVMK